MPETSIEPADHTSFAPRDALSTALRGWWLVAAAVLVGGLFGLLFSELRPPLYETSFNVPTSIDEINSGEQTQFDKDLAMETVGVILYNPDLFARISKAAAQQGLQVDSAQVKASALEERQIGTWRVRVFGSSAHYSETLAHVWQGLAAADLDAARQHALIADRLYRTQLSLETCLAQSASSEPAAGQCGGGETHALEEQLAALAQNIAKERALSRGMPGSVLLDTSQKEILPAQQVRYNRNQMTAAGGLIGLVLGVWLAQSGLGSLLGKLLGGLLGKLLARRHGG